MPARVIVVDSSRTIRTYLSYILKRADCEVLTAGNINEGLSLLGEKGKVDAILSSLDLDCEPCDMKGLHLFIEAAPTVLMFSRVADAGFCDWLLREKVTGCLQKPIKEEDLLRTLMRVLKENGRNLSAS